MQPTPQQLAAMQLAAQQQAAAAPAVPLERGRPKTLDYDDFRGDTPIVGSPSRLASFQVPRNSIFEIKRSEPMYIKIRAQNTGEIASNADTSFVIDLGAAGRDLVRSPSPANTPTQYHPDVTVWLSADNGTTWVRANVTAVDDTANTVTIEKAASTAYKYELYYLPGEGELVIQSRTAAGVDARTDRLFNSTLRALNETYQAKGREAPKINDGVGDNISFAPKETIDLLINSQATFVWNERAEHQLLIPGQIVSVNVHNEALLNKVIQHGKF